MGKKKSLLSENFVVSKQGLYVNEGGSNQKFP